MLKITVCIFQEPCYIGALCNGKRFAVGLFESSINGDIFETWVEQILLAVLPASSVIVMDNAAFHKRESTKALH